VSDTIFIDVGAIAIFVLLALVVSWFIWGRWLSKLDERYQTLMDVVAIILSGLVIFSFAMGWTNTLFGFVV
jgi:F0F1-type ATP synthase membrane subunit b/b'